MRGRKTSLVVVLTEEERTILLRWSRSSSLPAGLVTRAQAIFLVAGGLPICHTAQAVGLTERHVRQWVRRFLEKRLNGLYDLPGRGRKPVFPPEIDDYIVKMACERPDPCGRSLSQWDCQQIADQLVRQGLVASIGRETVRLRLKRNKLKPWRYKMWLSAKVPRDAAFAARVTVIGDLYTRPLAPDEIVLCLDENTNLQPRPRLSETLAAGIGQPMRLEHEYKRCGALNLLAAFDTRTGQVYGYLAERKRQIELIAFLNQLEEQIPANIRTIHVVLDNVPMHTGKKIQAWLAKHPRFIWYHPPVHCSWMNQVEQWFGILKRQRLRIVDFADKAALSERIQTFIAQWNERAHPFRWTRKSFDKILAKCKPSEPTAETVAQAA